MVVASAIVEKKNVQMLKRIAIFGSFALLGLQAIWVVLGWDSYQYDFRAFYIGARLFAEQQDPYSLAALQAYEAELGLQPKGHPFIYAPYMLWAFAPIAALPFKAAFSVWLFIQAISIAMISHVALRYLKPDPVVFAILLAVGLNGSIAAVLRTGQLTLLLLALILVGLALLMKRRVIGAAIALILAAIPKIWLFPMLALLLARPYMRRTMLMASGLAIIVGLLVLGAVLHPDFHKTFMSTVGNLSSRNIAVGPQNGSFQNLLISTSLLVGSSVEVAKLFWLALVLCISAISAFRYFQTVSADNVNFAYLFCLVALGLCIVSPRVMIYQWCIALPSLAYVISYMRNRQMAYTLLILAIMPTIYINRFLFGLDIHERVEALAALPWAFSNLIVVVIAWLTLIIAGPAKFRRDVS